MMKKVQQMKNQKTNKESNYLPQKQFKVSEYIRRLRIAFQCLLLPVNFASCQFQGIKTTNLVYFVKIRKN